MYEATLEINGVPTNIITCGRNLQEPPRKTPDEIILIIPGNPGIPGFYKQFMETLHEKTGFPVWTIGHSGHAAASSPLQNHQQLYGLQGQVHHKAAFFRDFVPQGARVHLMGHSIGAYMCLELLKDPTINEQIATVNLLFPTIEWMAETTNGKIISNYVTPVLPIIFFLALIYTVLPTLIYEFFSLIYMKLNAIPKIHLSNLNALVKPEVLKKVFFLAHEELEIVKERNNEVIKQNIGKIRFLYGAKDGWAPHSYCEALQSEIPGVKAECSTFNHSFVLGQSKDVGNLVSEWILTK